jgi:predicted amidohydrolase YtcJ
MYLAFSSFLLAPAVSANQAGTIFINGEIMTPGGWAEALAVRDGVIVAVGTKEDVLSEVTGSGKVMDLQGRAVLPGLYDMHVHAFFAGQKKRACSLPGSAKAKAIVDAVKACVANAKAGEWVTGGSWVGASFAPGEQNKRLLDAVSPDNPVVLTDESLHSVWANSKALQLAGITRDTPDPEGGVIDRDSRGEPTGVLRETAGRAVMDSLPAAELATQLADIKAATDEMLSYGIVAFTDASIRNNYVAGMSEYARSGGLRQYARGCMVWGPNSDGSESLITLRQQYSAGRLRLDCVKLFLDGVPIESHTAAMLEPYVTRNDDDQAHAGGEDRGMLMIPQDKLNNAVAEFDRQGLEIKFHAAGDAAVRAAIDAIEHARASNGHGGPRHHVGHNTFVDPADLPRSRELGFAWEFSPYIWYPTPITSTDIMNAVGPQRIERLWPIKDALDTGALVTAGSDWPVVPSVNPWLGIETLVSRQVPGATGAPIGEGQRITVEQALQVFTRNGAALMGRLDKGGTIEVGKLADLIVLDRNPVKIATGQIHETRVLHTFIAGEEVYSAPTRGK